MIRELHCVENIDIKTERLQRKYGRFIACKEIDPSVVILALSSFLFHTTIARDLQVGISILETINKKSPTVTYHVRLNAEHTIRFVFHL